MGASSGGAPKAGESGKPAGGGLAQASAPKSAAREHALKFAHDTHQSSILLVAPGGSEKPQQASEMSQENKESAATTAMEVATLVRLPLSETVQQQ